MGPADLAVRLYDARITLRRRADWGCADRRIVAILSDTRAWAARRAFHAGARQSVFKSRAGKRRANGGAMARKPAINVGAVLWSVSAGPPPDSRKPRQATTRVHRTSRVTAFSIRPLKTSCGISAPTGLPKPICPAPSTPGISNMSPTSSTGPARSPAARRPTPFSTPIRRLRSV